MTTDDAVLVVIHAGSACGSAEFNLGRQEARAAREDLARHIAGWHGDLVVIKTDLDDELPGTELGRTIDAALTRARRSGRFVRHCYGADLGSPSLDGALRRIFRPAAISRDRKLVLTGAWLEDGGKGCVGAAYDTLESLGYRRLDIADSVLRLDGPAPECDEDVADQAMDMTP